MTAPTRQCPECGGRIHAIAGRCKHCKAELVGPDTATPVSAPHGPAGHASLDRPVASGWSRRWPVIAMALALLVIGASVGVLVERWLRSDQDSEIRRRPPGNSPRDIPDRMPRPSVPEP